MSVTRAPESWWERFFANVPKVAEDECWEWQGSIATTGYGRVYLRRRALLAHRLVYERLVGPIPEGLQIDHLCRNRRCVNPTHLEAVTQRENILRGEGVSARAARKTHCLNGHPFAGENLAYDSQGARVCLTCRRARIAEFTRQRRERRIAERAVA